MASIDTLFIEKNLQKADISTVTGLKGICMRKNSSTGFIFDADLAMGFWICRRDLWKYSGTEDSKEDAKQIVSRRKRNVKLVRWMEKSIIIDEKWQGEQSGML